jgi:Predicted methyltransferase
MKNVLLFSLPFLFSSAVLAASPTSEKAVSAKTRTADDLKADEFRHPKELLDFSKVKAGDKVVDFIPGRGYWTRLFSNVVGPKGKVIAYIPKEIEGAPFKPVETTKKAIDGLFNTEFLMTPLLKMNLEKVDVVWTSQNYHDLKVKKFIDTDIAAFNKQIFAMLKPGGYFIVVDHIANAGATDADIDKLHRIDPSLVKKEVEAAGFVLEEESKVLNQKDDHSLNVFDPAIRGKTDQFAYRFVKPKK